MGIDDFINSINIFDLLVIGALVGMFLLGYVQGVIRRLIGIVAVTFSFAMAANLRGPLGDFLARNWTQFPAEYSRMVGFGVIFLVLVIALALIAQVYYKPAALWPRTPLVEDTVGGFLGVVQGLIILIALIVIMDPYFRDAGAPAGNELPFIRGLHDLMKGSATLSLFRDSLIPGFINLFGPFIPDLVKQSFPVRGT